MGALGLPVLVTEVRNLLGLLQNEFLQAAGEERVLQQLDLHATRLVQYLSRNTDGFGMTNDTYW